MIKKNNKNILKTIKLLIVYEILSITVLILLFSGVMGYGDVATIFLMTGITFVYIPIIVFFILTTYNLFHYIKYYFLKENLLEIKNDKIIINLPMLYNIEIFKKDIDSTSITIDRNILTITTKKERKITDNKIFFFLAQAITSTISYQQHKISFSTTFLEENKINEFLNIDQSYTKYLEYKEKYLKENNLKEEKELFKNNELTIKYIKELFENVLDSRNKISFFTNIEYNKICKYINK